MFSVTETYKVMPSVKCRLHRSCEKELSLKRKEAVLPANMYGYSGYWNDWYVTPDI